MAKQNRSTSIAESTARMLTPNQPLEREDGAVQALQQALCLQLPSKISPSFQEGWSLIFGEAGSSTRPFAERSSAQIDEAPCPLLFTTDHQRTTHFLALSQCTPPATKQ
jgi:hypothetical protein